MTHLHKSWGFQCSCRRCTAEPHLVAESDDRVAQIRNLWAELDDYTATSTGSPEKAELLITLQELEGQLGRIHEAYFRAAIEWNAVGQPATAAKYARMCLHRGLVMRGANRPFHKSMQDLIKNPEEHWSWKFRLKAAESKGED